MDRNPERKRKNIKSGDTAAILPRNLPLFAFGDLTYARNNLIGRCFDKRFNHACAPLVDFARHTGLWRRIPRQNVVDAIDQVVSKIDNIQQRVDGVVVLPDNDSAVGIDARGCTAKQ